MSESSARQLEPDEIAEWLGGTVAGRLSDSLGPADRPAGRAAPLVAATLAALLAAFIAARIGSEGSAPGVPVVLPLLVILALGAKLAVRSRGRRTTTGERDLVARGEGLWIGGLGGTLLPWRKVTGLQEVASPQSGGRCVINHEGGVLWLDLREPGNAVIAATVKRLLAARATGWLLPGEVDRHTLGASASGLSRLRGAGEDDVERGLSQVDA
ncbi:MAG: hypothetical protein IT204_00385 [Fimbriimonadaceae bacterium]|nr:hypothetical protein [Fimbriimonadaceae bacterium]